MFPTVSANSTHRRWRRMTWRGSGGCIRSRAGVRRHSGRCLDIEAISAANGADAIQWDYWGGQNQIFRIEWVEASHYRLIAQHSGRSST